ncbi:very-short-patch-repair endonuclease [Kribbella sp. VKM Ac-2527]|uniref:Very-short-patch-repair endonuclease n=1 Tax=Kribbella caucasensis TaxID=2512215 RepID=A0A4R6KSS3_9ACTN|nr:type IV toxin-antitoxin system AbiEi family antitoxin domain-containing protein [Kribbella sp. VKM Ac-2527]TDO54528.1 very-short-patch-repair endonuclease [Kribbella sp. VKM Ac-2527]
MTDVGDVLSRHGGSATFAELRTVVPARHIRAALVAGQIRRVAKGVYALPEAPAALTAARSHGGVVSHLSAAQHWKINIISTPTLPHVTLPPGRVRRSAGLPCTLHWAEAPSIGDVTTPVRTVLDCIRTLPLSDALAVTDSALHQSIVDPDELFAAAADLRGPHRKRIQQVVALADGRAESVLESALRAILIEADIEGFEPQVVVQDSGFSARLDLAHRQLRIDLEADGFEHHSTRTALVRDCRRQVNLSIRGWTVLRFSWEDIMYSPEWVVEAVALATVSPPLTKHLRQAA